MAWASKKQYAILMNSEEGKDLAEQLGELSQEEFEKKFGELLGKGGQSSTSVKNNEKQDSLEEDEYDDRKEIIENGKEDWVKTSEDEKVWNSLSNDDKYLLSMSGDMSFWYDEVMDNEDVKQYYDEISSKFSMNKKAESIEEEKEKQSLNNPQTSANNNQKSSKKYKVTWDSLGDGKSNWYPGTSSMFDMDIRELQGYIDNEEKWLQWADKRMKEEPNNIILPPAIEGGRNEIVRRKGIIDRLNGIKSEYDNMKTQWDDLENNAINLYDDAVATYMNWDNYQKQYGKDKADEMYGEEFNTKLDKYKKAKKLRIELEKKMQELYNNAKQGR